MDINNQHDLEVAARAINERFPYYGDLWLTQHDIFNQMTIGEVMQLGLTNNILLIPAKEMAYLDGSKLGLTNYVAMISAVNRLVKSDDKYKAIIEKRNKNLKIIKYGEMPQDEVKSQMFG